MRLFYSRTKKISAHNNPNLTPQYFIISVLLVIIDLNFLAARILFGLNLKYLMRRILRARHRIEIFQNKLISQRVCISES